MFSSMKDDEFVFCCNDNDRFDSDINPKKDKYSNIDYVQLKFNNTSVEEIGGVTTSTTANATHTLSGESCVCHWNNTSLRWILERANDTADVIPQCTYKTITNNKPDEHYNGDSSCELWNQLNEQQKGFIKFINEIATNDKVFNRPQEYVSGRRKEHVKRYGHLSPFHLYNTKNRCAVIFLEGLGGTGKTKLMEFVQKHVRGCTHYITIKHIVLSSFYENLCKIHCEYNIGHIEDIVMDKSYLSTVAKILGMQINNMQLNEDTAFADFGYTLSARRLQITRQSFNEYQGFYVCIIDEYSMLSSRHFLIILNLLRELTYNIIFVLCGDKNQCKPIHMSKKYNDNYDDDDVNVNNDEDDDNTYSNEEDDLMCNIDPILDALPIECIDMAKFILGKKHVFEYTLTKLIRSMNDVVLQNLIVSMADHQRQNIDDRKRLLKCFAERNDINIKHGQIDISKIINEYRRVMASDKYEHPNIEIFKILVIRNTQCYSLYNELIEMILTNLSLYFNADIIHKYFMKYTVETKDMLSSYTQYLVVGFEYKILQNLLPNHHNSYDLPNGSVVQIVELNYHTFPNMVMSVTVVNKKGKRYRLFPTYNIKDNRMKDKNGHIISHLGFPLQANCIENSYQSQGTTLHENSIYINCASATAEDVYVMITRCQTLSQLKAIINV